IRGSDVPHTPLLLAYAILATDGRHRLYVDPARLSPQVAAHLEPLCECRAPERIEDDIAALAATGARIAIDPASAAWAFARLIAEGGARAVHMRDPAALPRAAKNEAELAGMRAAHRRDGAAVSEFLAWLDRQQP